MKHASIAGTVTWVLGVVSFVMFVLERLALPQRSAGSCGWCVVLWVSRSITSGWRKATT